MGTFNNKKIDYSKQPMFFGEALNSQRMDLMRYPIFHKITETMKSFYWVPKEVSLLKDVADYARIPEEHKHIFTSNLKYQILLDSIQGRGPGLALLPFCSLPELEAAIQVWQFFEHVHSDSYQHIIKSIYTKPSDVFDLIIEDKEIVVRATAVTKYYDEFLELAARHRHSFGQHEYEIKRAFYKMFMSIGILEGIRFYASFACTFAFGEIKLMEGSAKILQFIARDEAQHFAITANVVRNWCDEEKDPVMLEIIADCEKEIEQMFFDAVQQEKDWSAYLFSKGSMIGLNEVLLNQYIEYMANKRAKSLRIAQLFPDAPKHNPLPWTEHWLSSKGVQIAPQEVEIFSYLVGAIDSDVNHTSLKDFEL